MTKYPMVKSDVGFRLVPHSVSQTDNTLVYVIARFKTKKRASKFIEYIVDKVSGGSTVSFVTPLTALPFASNAIKHLYIVKQWSGFNPTGTPTRQISFGRIGTTGSATLTFVEVENEFEVRMNVPIS